MRKVFAVTVAVVMLCLGGIANAITIDTVTIGNPGNSDDTTGYGGVSYAYNIGKYEVTKAQYVAFLNGVGGTNVDKYALYNSLSGITKTGDGATATYSIALANANLPVAYVSWFDALRFANWMSNGQGSGSTETGSYMITNGGLNSGTVAVPNHEPGLTNKWYLTSEDEWYKAAYYNGVYSLYANGTGTAPVKGISSNYNNTSTFSPWNVGTGALEQNGTEDMMGNLSEWNEAIIPSGYGPIYHGLRGGSWQDGVNNLKASTRVTFDPFEGLYLGFRVSEVSAVPEPTTILLLGLGLVGLVSIKLKL
jgi:formylglycine-generating enzyme